MKTIKIGNILSVKSGIIVHGCNAQGVMGSGIAAKLRMMYPEIFNHYLDLLKVAGSPEAAMGRVVIVPVSDTLFVANAITQLNFGRDPNKRYVSYSAIQTAFENLAALDDADIHYPQIGAGLGNGDWSIISDIIDVALHNKNHTFWVYE